MKLNNFVITALIAITLALAPASLLASETYKVDSAHTFIVFKVLHLNLGYAYGRFNNPVGTVVWDENNPASSTIEMQVNAKDVDTNVAKRDDDLRSANFFNAEKYPTISFKSTSFKKVGADAFEISGDLTLLGQTRSVTVTAQQTGAGKDPWGNYRRGFETSFTFKRSEWSMDFMLQGVGDEVMLMVSMEGVRQ